MSKFYLYLGLFILSSCSPRAIKIADDVIEGEVKVVEDVIKDVGGVPHACYDPEPIPNVSIVICRF